MRYIITLWHGESITLHYIVDTFAPESEQPAVVESFRSRDIAESECAKYNADENAAREFAWSAR